MEYSTHVLDTQNKKSGGKDLREKSEPFHLKDPLRPVQDRSAHSETRTMWRALKKDPIAFAALVLLTIIVLSAVIAPLISPYEKDKIDLTKQYLPPSISHPFGTDDLGRDFFVRVMYGGRVSLAVGLMAVVLALVLGLIAGGVAGFYGGIADTLIMRTVDLMLSIPIFFVILFLASTVTPGIVAICVLIGLTQWMEVARLVRAIVIATKHQEFVVAAQALGLPDRTIIGRHILPHTTAPVLVATTIGMATAIILESALSFLGFGVQPPTPSWGAMLQNAQGYLSNFPWMAIFPGLMIFLTVVCCFVLGDFLSAALNPIRFKHVQ
jgi:peptide/nickel transport system permease protein